METQYDVHLYRQPGSIPTPYKAGLIGRPETFREAKSMEDAINALYESVLDEVKLILKGAVD